MRSAKLFRGDELADLNAGTAESSGNTPTHVRLVTAPAR